MSTASAIIHSVRLISSGLDHSDAFVAFEDGRVLATGIGSGWRELAGYDTEVLDGVGHVLTPGLLDIHNHGGAGASYTARTAMPSVRLCDSTASTAPPVSCCRWSPLPRRFDLPNSRRGG